ncbi:autotransporter outer membrane beta-barrel domain-containing protein [Campylobacter lari]|nr:autotransporter outer membrane beta-barrel domain-containing protein [Campylobacter lari]EJV5920242.1 autotransporter outer membrane beta-barrel domain-containing protein [Campylobacter lari]
MVNSTIQNLNNNGGNINGNIAGGAIYNQGSINTLNNTGVINGNVSGIKNQGTIGLISNSGTINGGSHFGIYANNSNVIKTIENKEGGVISGGSDGIRADGGATINTLTNKGIISAKNGSGIAIERSSKIETISNSGTINSYGNSSGGGIFSRATNIDHISNSGLIKNDSNSGDYHGVYFVGANFKTIENSKNGTIETKGSGIKLSWFSNQNAQGELVKNDGTIKAGGSGITLLAGSTIDNVDNSGVIKAENHGIELYDVGYGTNSSIYVKTVNNSGTIIAKNNGIVFRDGRTNNNYSAMTIDNINNTGTIIAGRYGITLNDTKNAYQIGKISLGGLVSGDVAGFFIGANQKLTKDINVTGTLAGGEAGIINKGHLGNTDKTGGIKLDGGTIAATSLIDGAMYYNVNGVAIKNTENGIIYGDTELKNKASIIGDFINEANGQIEGSIKLSDESKILGNINNIGTGNINGSIELTDKSYIAGIVNSGSGKITGNVSVDSSSEIGNIINAGSGEISGNVKVDNSSKVGNIINGTLASSFYNNELSTGKISGDVSVDNKSVVGNIINAGKGEITGGIKVDNNSEVTNISNAGNGLISSNVSVNNGSKVGNIFNSDYGKISGDISIGKNSSVGGVVNSGNGEVSGDIKVEEGGKVEEIVNDGNGQITGGIDVGSGSSVGGITNSGNGNIGGSITNNGDLGSINNSGSITGSIENNSGNLDIKNDGELGGSITIGQNGGNTSISNGSNGNIGGGITNNGNSNINIDNQGTVKPDSNGNHITNNGNGNVIVDDWIVKPNEDGSISGAINVGGNGNGSIKVDNVTVDTSDPNYDATKPINPGGVVNNNSSNGGSIEVGNIGSNNNLLNLVYDPITGQYKALADVSAGVGSVMAQTVINTYMMRSFFLDTVLDDASRMAYKHARVHNHHKNNKDIVGFQTDEHYHGFVLPYFSSNSIKLLGTNDYSKGHTKGIVAGFHTLRDIGMLGAYVGTEEANMDTKDYFSLKMQTVYAGLKYSNLLLEDEIKEAFFKFHTKAAYTKNDVQKFVDKGKREASGNTDTYGYGASIGTGMNFYLDGVDSVITPEVSLNYEGGFTKAFSMHGDGALSHERYYKSELNLFSSTASLKWLNKWHPQISTSLEAGARINFNPEVESRVNFANLKASETLDLPRTYQYASASLIFSLAEDLEMSFNYNGTFANNSHSHTGFLQFDFIF